MNSNNKPSQATRDLIIAVANKRTAIIVSGVDTPPSEETIQEAHAFASANVGSRSAHKDNDYYYKLREFFLPTMAEKFEPYNEDGFLFEEGYKRD